MNKTNKMNKAIEIYCDVLLSLLCYFFFLIRDKNIKTINVLCGSMAGIKINFDPFLNNKYIQI